MEGDVVVEGMLTVFSAETTLSRIETEEELEEERDKLGHLLPIKGSLDDFTADVTQRPS